MGLPQQFYETLALIDELCLKNMSAVVLYKPKFSRDGNQFCFLYGDNLQEGVAGFGDTPEQAALDFHKNWYSHDISNTKTVRLKEAKERLKKSGSVEDAADVLSCLL